jgi:hypothetical protein
MSPPLYLRLLVLWVGIGKALRLHAAAQNTPKKRVGTETFCPGRAGKQAPSREYHRHYKSEHHQREQDGDPQV